MKWISEVSIRNASCHLLKIKWKIVREAKNLYCQRYDERGAGSVDTNVLKVQCGESHLLDCLVRAGRGNK